MAVEMVVQKLAVVADAMLAAKTAEEVTAPKSVKVLSTTMAVTAAMMTMAAMVARAEIVKSGAAPVTKAAQSKRQ
jgi:hypothetical protein